MSVGICIINHNGIALAADSAGTVGNHKMFYNSMNKVFSISKKNTIGAISYGSTRINDVLIDQILKEFRTYLDESIGVIGDFFDIEKHFNAFIHDYSSYYEFDNYIAKMVRECELRLVLQWKQRIQNGISSMSETICDNSCADGSIVEEKIQDDNPIKKIVKQLSEEVEKKKTVVRNDYTNVLVTKYTMIIEKALTDLMPDLSKYNDEKNEIVSQLIKYINYSWNSEGELGLFIAGYGSKSAFPKYIHLSISRTIDGKLYYTVIERGPKNTGDDVIIPLAQPDIIMMFCKGIHADLQNLYPVLISKMINSRIDSLDDKQFSKNQKKILKEKFNTISCDVNASINGQIKQNNVDPLFTGLMYLPIPEMASLAENLVNMTTLRRRYVLDGNQQTVGGPTDVAVLSKGDGFIWIKRKHYFEKDLNADFFNK